MSPSAAGSVVTAAEPSRVKSAALRAMTASGFANLFRPLTRSAGVVFMLHRFSDPERGIRGHDPASVRALLGYLRREDYRLVDLETLFASLSGDAPPVRHPVVFTIDDGYLDHAAIAAPVFAEFDCPVTTFLTTGFLDGALWFWWDQIQYIFAHTAVLRLALDLDGVAIAYAIDDAAARGRAEDDFITRCKALPENRKRAAIIQLAAAAQVEPPQSPPDAYAPMTWDQVRACERRGMTFAPHSVTHPILARTDDVQARTEIETSWCRLRSEAAAPVPIFAYPNGLPGDFGEREFRLLRSIGLRGAVTGVAGFATHRHYRGESGQYRIPRFPFPDSMPHLIQQVGGLERLKFMLRGMH